MDLNEILVFTPVVAGSQPKPQSARTLTLPIALEQPFEIVRNPTSNTWQSCAAYEEPDRRTRQPTSSFTLRMETRDEVELAAVDRETLALDCHVIPRC
jgi:hypothetical protein